MASNCICLLQHNLGRGKVATAELRRWGLLHHASIFLVQEPWTRHLEARHTVCGMGTTSNRILVGTTTEVPKACIVITDPLLDVLFLPSLRRLPVSVHRFLPPVALFM